MDTTLTKVCIIGAGNVATHLSYALNKCTNIIQIYSHTLSNARLLSESIGKPDIATDNISSITCDADIYIVSIKDDCIADVIAHTPNCGIWAHTSGSTSISIFEGFKTNYGVFYPLQTFSKYTSVNMHNVPFFIEGNNDDTYNLLANLAQLISDTVIRADSNRRKLLHLSAVFACNFVNYMWTLAQDILQTDNLDISYLMPLLQETLNKISTTSPHEAQTGPARRGDIQIIQSHLSELSGEKREIYELISSMILNRYNTLKQKPQQL